MRLLLVEDDDNKRQRISNLVFSAYADASVVEARSLRSAEDALDDGKYDVVILDMSMPTFDVGREEHGGDFQALGGHELLRYMGRYRITTPVVVLTQFTTFGRGKDALTLMQLEAKLNSEHHGIYRGTVYYDTASEEWRAKLLQSIASATETP